MTPLLYVAVSIILLYSYHADAKGLTILEPSTLAGEYVSGPVATYTNEFNVSAPLISLDICDQSTLDNKADLIKKSIVLVTADYNNKMCISVPSEAIDRLRNYEPLGIILKDFQSVGYSEILEPNPPNHLTNIIPILSINRVSFDDLASYHSEIFVNIQRPETNPWLDLVRSAPGIILQVIIAAILILTIVIAVYKLWKFIQYHGVELSVTQTCLELDLVASILRLVFDVDPLGFYGILTIKTSSSLFELSCAFSLSSIVLIAFYWSDILNNVGSFSRQSAWLKDKKKPFFITIAAIFGSIFLVSIIDLAIPGQSIASLLVVIFLFIICSLVTIYFISNGLKVYQILNIAASNKKERALKTVTVMIVSLSVVLILTIISLALLSTKYHNTSNVEYLLTNFNWYFWAVVGSLIVVLTFQTPDMTDSTSSPTVSIQPVTSKDRLTLPVSTSAENV